jgi:glycosyltransferase involved in cell wall biosynthesis
MEALAAGLPVVASRVGGIPDLITDQVTGLLIPSKDSEALETALARYVHNPDWAKRLGQAGRATAHARFDIGATTQANEALYYELLV